MIEFMKSEFCHTNLLYGTVDMKALIRDDFGDDKLCEKLRKFYIPILGMLTMAGANEPEVIKEIKMILNDSKVDTMLKKKVCDKDKAPMGITEDRIPDLMKFIPSHVYFMDDLPLKYNLPRKPDKAEHIRSLVKNMPKEKSRELVLRRCASIDRASPKIYREKIKDKILFSLIKPLNDHPEHKTLSDNEITDDEDLETRQTSLFNYIYIPNREPEPTDYQKLGLMNPFETLEISSVEPSILEEKPPLPALSHPNAGDFMALVALEAMQVLPREWVTLLQNGKLTVMCRALSQKGLIMIKGFSSMPRPPEQVLGVLLSDEFTKQEDGIFTNFTLLEVRPYFDVCVFQVNTVKGITPREWAARRSHVKDFPCEKGFTMLLNNMDDDKLLSNPEAVKGKVLSGGMVCRPIGKKATQVSLVFKAEMGGLIPTRIIHEMIVTILEKFINDLRNSCDITSEYDSELEAQKEAEEVDPEFIE